MAAKTITIKNKTDKAKLAIAADARNVSPVMIATVAPGKSFAYSTESETEVAVFEELQKKLDSSLFEITIA